MHDAAFGWVVGQDAVHGGAVVPHDHVGGESMTSISCSRCGGTVATAITAEHLAKHLLGAVFECPHFGEPWTAQGGKPIRD